MKTYTVTYRTHSSDGAALGTQSWTGQAEDGEHALDLALIDAEDRGVIHGDVLSIKKVS